MFSNIHKIEGVSPNGKNYLLFENNLYYKKNDFSVCRLSLKSKKGIEIIHSNEKVNNILLVKDKLAITDNVYNTFIYQNEDLNFYSFSKLESIIFRIQINSGKFAIISKSNLLNYLDNSTGIYDTHNNLVLFLKKNFFPRFFSDDLLFGYSIKDELLRYNVSTGEEKWANSLTMHEKYEENPLLRKFIGVYHTNLWLILSSGYLVAVDVEMGKQKAVIEGFPPIQDAFLDKKKGIIFHFFRGIYYQLDLNTHLIEKIDLKSQMQNEGFWSVLVDYDTNYMYYIDPSRGWVGAIERDSLIISWQYNFKEIHTARPIELKVYEGNLYLCDSSNTLNIFEKEETQISI